jgi:hypothetical protein
VPRRAGDRVKTNRRDADQLARLTGRGTDCHPRARPAGQGTQSSKLKESSNPKATNGQASEVPGSGEIRSCSVAVTPRLLSFELPLSFELWILSFPPCGFSSRRGLRGLRRADGTCRLFDGGSFAT